MLDAGDIIQTLSGWTVIGHSKSQVGGSRRPFHFREKAAESQKGIQVMNDAVSHLSLQCAPQDAGRGLYLITGSTEDIDVNIVKDVGAHLKRLAPEAIIRTGDYPREKGTVDVTIILSELSGVRKVVDYFTQTIELITAIKRKREGVEVEHRDLEQSFKDIPMLL